MDTITTLRSVSDTLLIPLYCRAYESKSKDPILIDPIAELVYEKAKAEIQDSTKKIHRKLIDNAYSKKLIVTMALRARRFDRYVLEYLKGDPDGIVVSLGSGLDTRFFRIDNGRVRWFDLDFPNVVKLREKYIPHHERSKIIAASVFDYSWMDAIERNKKVLFIAEGLLMYLREADVKELFKRLQKNFPGSQMVCEVCSKYIVSKMNTRYIRFKFQKQLGFEKDSAFTFGIDKAEEVEQWSEGITLIDEWTYFDDNEKKLGWMNLLGSIQRLRTMQWVVRYTL